jgi:hypothetical protein
MPTSREESLKKQAVRMGQPIPDKIANKPFLKSHLTLYFDGFLDLQFDRNESGYIPWSVIIKYAEHHEFDKTQTENLVYFIRRLDECYKNWSKKRSKQTEA